MHRSGLSESKQLATVSEIGQILSESLSTKHSLHRILELLERRHGMFRSSLLLIRGDSNELLLEASNGISSDTRTDRHMDSEIAASVLASAKPVVIPQVSHEPMFLNHGAGRKTSGAELSFVCVPVLLARKAIGALTIEMHFNRDRDYEATVKFLRAVSGMIAQAVRVDRMVKAETQRLMEENSTLRKELQESYDYPNMVGHSGPMRQVYEQVAQVAATNTTVLIRGESGTGKELIAHAVHHSSPRAKKPFVKVSCAALPESLIESELFGYEKGAFSGAQTRKKGRFELAEGGTLFLDEIGDVNLTTQVKLLRVLQEREFERLGGIETIGINVRLIAATNKSLEKAITDGTFREDLFYRLNVFAIFLPPLRERKPDVMSLADHFLEKYAREHGKSIKRISTPAIDMLMSYHWPGNVRELENAIERAVLVCDGNVIHGHHLPPTLQTAESSGTVPTVPLTEAIAAYEKDLIQDALKTTGGNCAKAARLLGSTERIINYKIRKHGIDCRRFRA